MFGIEPRWRYCWRIQKTHFQAIAHLQEGTATLQQLTQNLSQREGIEAGEQFAITLQQMDERGWLQYAVFPLAIAVPMVESAELDLDAPHWTQASVSLSRFAYQRSHEGGIRHHCLLTT